MDALLSLASGVFGLNSVSVSPIFCVVSLDPPETMSLILAIRESGSLSSAPRPEANFVVLLECSTHSKSLYLSDCFGHSPDGLDFEVSSISVENSQLCSASIRLGLAEWVTC